MILLLWPYYGPSSEQCTVMESSCTGIQLKGSQALKGSELFLFDTPVKYSEFTNNLTISFWRMHNICVFFALCVLSIVLL